jgi:glycosyltransferase involved in cell wall biosynthesis
MEKLDDRFIDSVPIGDLLCAAVERSPRLRPWSQRLDMWSYHLRHFQHQVAKRIRILRPRVVLCYDTCSLQIFEAAREVGAVCVLDQTIGHITQCVQELARAGVDLTLPKGFVRECTREVHEADLILAPSEYVVSTLTALGVPSSKILLLPYGVDLERFHQSPRATRAKPVRALYIGQLSARKGVRYLIEAFDQLQHPALELMMVGRLLGDPAWIRPRGDRFFYQPPLPQHEIDAVYQSADFFVQLSLHEGSTLTIFEAIASGLPVITTPNAGSVVRDGIEGFIVPVRDTKAVVERMRTLVEDDALRLQMGARARQRAEMFSWHAYRNRLAQALADLAAAPPAERLAILSAHQENMKAVMRTDVRTH